MSKIQYSVTTVKIEEGLKERLKVLAIRAGRKLQDLINDLLAEGADNFEKKSKKND